MKQSLFRRKKQKPTHAQPSLKQNLEEEEVNLELLTKFSAFVTRCKQDKLRRGLKNLFGRNYPINYRSQFQFQEQWEKKKKQFEENNFYQFIQSQRPAAYLYTFLLLIFKITIVWYISLFRIFSFDENSLTQLVLVFSIAISLIDSGVKYRLKYGTNFTFDYLDFLRTFKYQAYQIIYSIISLITLSQNTSHLLNATLYFYDLSAVYFNYKRAQNLLYQIKIRSYTSPHKNQFKIFDLLSNLLIIAHAFSLLLYAAALSQPQNNWMLSLGINYMSPLSQYLYSFYFCSTTLLTIGYGDIIPVNQLEIICILVAQVFGVASLSYLINQIGHTISSMRKEEESLQHNISTLSKISCYYGLEKELENTAKSFLINNCKNNYQLHPNEQNNLLMKLNEELREQISHTNNLKIIKSCVFFICHWSKQLQIEVARRLVRKIFNPNQSLSQSLGRERLYIVKSGKVQIYTNKYSGFKKQFKKLLRVIEPKKKGQIFQNVYGYSSVIGTKPIKLQAIAKDISCTYFIDRQSFMECVNNDKLDFEYFCEIKTKIQESKYPQSWQAPAILNFRQHYSPNVVRLIRKHIGDISSLKNERELFIRNQRSLLRRKTRIFTLNMDEIVLGSFEGNQIHLALPCLTLVEPLSIGEMQVQERSDNLQQKQRIMLHRFESAKQYPNYFRNNNLKSILAKLQKQNFVLQNYSQDYNYSTFFKPSSNNNSSNQRLPSECSPRLDS